MTLIKFVGVKSNIISKEWKLLKRIGNGLFGVIYSCINIKTGKEAAVKLIRKKKNLTRHLHNEHRALTLLSGGEGIVRVLWYDYSCINNEFVALVMDQLGPSLEDLIIFCQGKFSLKTSIMLADQMIHRIEFLHNRHLIHRDIKPENFLMGIGKQFNIVYIIDFGLAKQYIHPVSQQHLLFREFRNLIGTAEYCSINAHAGFEQSRRDDLEPLGYVLLYFLNGNLPWQKITGDTQLKSFHLIHEAKLNMKLSDFGVNVPDKLLKFVHYCRGLKFQEIPKYNHLRKLLWKIFDKYRLQYDFQFDWIEKRQI